ncbi:hypothetical protein HNR46_003085 [Haloferula luteola]|uniref:Glycosyl hydrolases family 43 n=1 Tax=Haloferula luteola TaxID=595692 RepID=A0A840V3G1_9BACT|nr:glycoside hydrolase family 43 protein [Haloferula luteola]MBB5352837.1 hypothetical protein [Haloferula luteola]
MNSSLNWIALVSLTSGSLSLARAEEPSTWVMAYFRQRYPTRVEVDAEGRIHEVPLPDPMQVEQLHLALSSDGRNWSPLNDNQPIWDQRLRDPFIHRGSDGLWHLLATGRAPGKPTDEGPHCLHATSPDLIHWSHRETLSLMKGVRNDDGAPARNIWAPEWFQEEGDPTITLLWSSSFEDAGWKKSRLWISQTTDWKTFTPAQEWFAPDYSVIDGSLLSAQGRYYLFHKEEEFGAASGERRAIRVAVSDQLQGPFEVFKGPINGGQIVPTITEGCAIMPDPQGSGWLLLYDYCMSNGYGASSSQDLLHWQAIDKAQFPPDARHASVFSVTPREAAALQTAFPSSPPRDLESPEGR